MLDDRTFVLSSNMAEIPLSFWISRDWLQTTYTNTAERQNCFLNHASTSLIIHEEKERESLQRAKKVWEYDFGYHETWQTIAFNFFKNKWFKKRHQTLGREFISFPNTLPRV